MQSATHLSRVASSALRFRAASATFHPSLSPALPPARPALRLQLRALSTRESVQFEVHDHNAPDDYALVELNAVIATSADEDQQIMDPFHPDHIPLNLMTVMQNKGVEIEGACGGELSCSTCHVLLDPEVYDSLGEVGEEEEDMLDLAYGFEEVSLASLFAP